MKLALLCLDKQLVSQEAFQDYSDMSDVILQGSLVDQDVIDIHDHLASKHVLILELVYIYIHIYMFYTCWNFMIWLHFRTILIDPKEILHTNMFNAPFNAKQIRPLFQNMLQMFKS